MEAASDPAHKTNLPFRPDPGLLQSLSGKTVLLKAGGNALTDSEVKNEIVSQIAVLHSLGIKTVVVHGGGIEIEHLLDGLKLDSEFIGGHRKTDTDTIRYIEMALSGGVNKELVKLLNRHGVNAVGISGKDGKMITARKRYHTGSKSNDEKIDLGYVGDVEAVDPSLINLLLDNGYIPVISPVSAGTDGEDYNINADMLAGHVAGALKAEKFAAITNIDGLLKNLNDPGSIMHKLTSDESKDLFGSVIQGGMIPKIEACLIALEAGVKSAHIINGTQKENVLRTLLTDEKIGTEIVNPNP